MNKEYKLSEGQKGLWKIQTANPQSTAYNTYFSAKVESDIDVYDLQKVSDLISVKHPILCARFIEKNGEILQTVNENNRVSFETYTFINEQEVRDFFNIEANKLIDLKNGPLSRFIVATTDDNNKYVLLITHHIVVDYWSLIVILKEIASIYKQMRNNEDFSLVANDCSFFDHIEMLDEYKTTDKYKKSLDYWKERLHKGVEELQLPFGKSRDMLKSETAESIVLQLDKGLTEKIYSESFKMGVTPFSFLLANYHIVLSYYFDNNNIATGVPFLGRHSKKHLDKIGYYVNTLPVNCLVNDTQSFAEYANLVQRDVRKIFSNQRVSYQELIEKYNDQGNSANQPLYQTMFVLEKARTSDFEGASLFFAGVEGITLDMGEIKFSSFPLLKKFAQSDLTCIFEKVNTSLHGVIQYNASHMTKEFMESFLNFYKNILDVTTSQPDKQIAELKVLLTKDVELIDRTNEHADNSMGDLYHKGGVSYYLEKQFNKVPDQIAIVTENHSVTYKELNYKSASIGKVLLSHPAQQTRRRALICCDKAIHSIYSIIAATRSGYSYILLDKGTPLTRVNEIIHQTSPEVILFDEGSSNVLKELRIPSDILTLNISRIEDSTDMLFESVYADDQDELYCVFTSGSSGNPKGISIPNDGVLRLVLNPNYCKLSNQNVIAQMNNLGFDATTFEIWGAFLNGAKLVLIEKEDLLSPDVLKEKISHNGVDTLFITTSLFNQYSTAESSPFKGVKQILFGGEKVNLDCVKKFSKNLPGCQFIHVYGPSETTTFATFHKIHDVESYEEDLPIGIPISDTVIDIRSQDGTHNLPIGVVGEMYIGGKGLANEYLNLEEETQRKFISIKLENGDITRLYRSGDLAYRNTQGEIVYCGRKDMQEKIRGFRVELTDIKKKIDKDITVEDSYITTVQDEFGQKQIVAYIKPFEINRFDLSITKDALKGLLPEYMIPSYFVIVEKFVLTKNGKIDKNNLPKLVIHQENVKYEAPITETERIISEIWCDILGRKKVSCIAEFFEVGGHSLLAMKIKMNMEERFSIKVAWEEFYTLTTIRKMAENIDKILLSGQNEQLSMPKIKRRARNKV